MDAALKEVSSLFGHFKGTPMDAKLKEVNSLFGQFKASYAKNDSPRCLQILSQLKLKLTEFPSLPPLYQQSPTAQQELILAREIFEHAVVLSVRMEDKDAFERNFLQLKAYYTDTRHLLPPSTQEYPILGLNLLRLLVQNRIAEFHTELELLPPDSQSNPYIYHAIEIEQSLMEGAYRRVLSSRQKIPDSTYIYFMDLLVQTVKQEIAGCSEKSYESLTFPEAQKILMVKSVAELEEYAAEHEWDLRDGQVFFQKVTKEPSACREIPSMSLVKQNLGYARELERIV
eukprot:TRINITY_DN7924_c0_g1_i2.p1 TRINITY_DN7924_c0_g1~~TRINITY_DN7924_c0_g1_i2.p1  ORF type:complete len:286 (+),score=55.00 TRINITY_DN7924_c0_g1_i2:141-998(+)